VDVLAVRDILHPKQRQQASAALQPSKGSWIWSWIWLIHWIASTIRSLRNKMELLTHRTRPHGASILRICWPIDACRIWDILLLSIQVVSATKEENTRLNALENLKYKMSKYQIPKTPYIDVSVRDHLSHSNGRQTPPESSRWCFGHQ